MLDALKLNSIDTIYGSLHSDKGRNASCGSRAMGYYKFPARWDHQSVGRRVSGLIRSGVCLGWEDYGVPLCRETKTHRLTAI